MRRAVLSRLIRFVAAGAVVVLAGAAASCYTPYESDSDADDDAPAPAAAAVESDGAAAGSAVAAPAAPGSAVAEVGELLVGYVLPATGSLVTLGGPISNGIKMATAEINASGFMTVRVLPGDSGTDPVIANRTVDDHIAEGVSAIVGAAASGISLAIIDKIVGARIVQVGPSNTSPSFTTYDDDGYYFRTIPANLLQARSLADLMTEDGVTAAGVIFRADDWGRNLADEMVRLLDANGVATTAFIDYDPEGASFDAEVQQLVAAGSNGTVLLAFDEGATIMRTMIEAGIGPADVTVYLANGMASNTLWEAVDPNDPAVLVGTKGTLYSTASEGGDATFTDRYIAAYPDAELAYAAPGYDAVIILALAALTARSATSDDIAAELVGVTRDGTKCSRFVDCAELIAAGVDIDYDGAGGPLEFSDVGEPSIGSYDNYHFDERGRIVRTSTYTSSIY